MAEPSETSRAASLEEIWRAYDADEARLSAHLSETMIRLAGLAPGMRVLDLAAGRGEPSLRAARAVSPGGSVLGVDTESRMLAMARERAVEEGVTNAIFVTSNAETLTGVDARPPFDAALCRWALMYMNDPGAALRTTRGVLRPDALFVVAVWADPERVNYHTLPRRVLARVAGTPDPAEYARDEPGVYRYGDARVLRAALEAEGYSVEGVHEVYVELMEAKRDEELVAWVRAFGMTRALERLSRETERAWVRAFVEEASKLRAADGYVRLGGVSLVAVARAKAAG